MIGWERYRMLIFHLKLISYAYEYASNVYGQKMTDWAFKKALNIRSIAPHSSPGIPRVGTQMADTWESESESRGGHGIYSQYNSPLWLRIHMLIAHWFLYLHVYHFCEATTHVPDIFDNTLFPCLSCPLSKTLWECLISLFLSQLLI